MQFTNQNLNVVKYVGLTILDKALVFLMPILILLYIDDVELYNKVELIYSFSAILVVISDFGLKAFVFYSYRTKLFKEKDLLNLSKKLSSSIAVVFYILFLFSYFSFGFFYELGDFSLMTVLAILARLCYLQFTLLESSICRLLDKPSAIYKLTLPLSVLTILTLFFKTFLYNALDVYGIFLVLQVYVIFYVLTNLFITTPPGLLKDFFRRTLTFGGPLIINGLLIVIINQFGKIYAFNFLTEDDMKNLSLSLRYSMLLQIIGSAIISYYVKKINVSNHYKIHLSIFLRYLASLLVITSIISLSLFFVNKYSDVMSVPIELLIVSLLSTLVVSLISYLEMYYNRNNLTKVVPLISFLAFLLYAFQINLSNSLTSEKLVWAMLLSYSVAFLVSVFIFMKKVRL